MSSPCILHSRCLLTPFSFSALSSLTQAAEEILHFDPTVVVMAWKAVGRMVCYLKTCSSHVLMACPAITSMCAAMRQQSNECASCGVRREKRVSIPLVFLCSLAYSLSPLYYCCWLLLCYSYIHTAVVHTSLTLLFIQDPQGQFAKLLKSCRFFAMLITKVVQVLVEETVSL